MTIDLIDYEHGICALDSGFFRKRLDATHPIIEDGHAAIVDTGINASVPLVQEALSTKGVRPEDVDFIMLTHRPVDGAGSRSDSYPVEITTPRSDSNPIGQGSRLNWQGRAVCFIGAPLCPLGSVVLARGV